MNLPFASYQTSRDYHKLWELAQTTQIVCIVDRYENDPTDRRIASTRYSPAEYYQITVEAFGIRWCSAANVDQFVQQCKRWSLEWLVPARDLLAAGPVGGGGDARCARIELVTAIYCLASHFEIACSDLSEDDLQKATTDIAHARRIAANHNQNGSGCPQLSPAARAALVAEPVGEGPSDVMQRLMDAPMDARGYVDLRRPAAPAASEVQRQAVIEAVAEALGKAYDCQRVREAWAVGTMGEDDFALVAEDGDRLAEIADAAIEAMRPAATPSPGELNG